MGFNTLKYGINPNDFFITQYNIFDENKFKFILQTLFFNHKLNFGGIPFSLDENEKYNKHIFICLTFFLNYRILSNKTFLDFLDILKKENNERVTLTEYKSIEEVTRKKLVDIGSVTLSTLDSFEICKKIIQYSIEFIDKLYLDTFKSLKKTKNKNTLVSQSDIDKKIGYFKQNVYTFINKLKEYYKNLKQQQQFEDKNIENFDLFLCGYLLQYIYILENFNKTKNLLMINSIKDLISKEPREADKILRINAEKSMKILTNVNSIKPKKRWFFWGRKYDKLRGNAQDEVNTNINPEIFTSHYWTRYEEKFKRFNGDKKLFVIALEPVLSPIKKLAKVNVWLIDIFATVKSFTKPIRRDKIKTIEEFDNKNKIVDKERYANDNNMILLNPFLRTLGEFKRYAKKLFSKKKGMNRKWTTGLLLQKFLGLRKKKLADANKYTGYTHEEIFILLIKGKLKKYTNDDPVKMALLMGYDNYQLQAILETYYKYTETLGQNKLRINLSKKDDRAKDWQLYLIKSKDYQSIDNIRMWTNNLLNSKPWIFLYNYLSKGSIPLSNFSNMQVPFESYFVKYQLMEAFTFVKTLPTLLLSLYDLIFKESNFGSQAGINTAIKSKKRDANIFISSEAFFYMDLPPDFDYKAYLEKGNNRLNTGRTRSRISVLSGPQPGFGGPQPGFGGPQPGFGGPQPGFGGPQPAIQAAQAQAAQAHAAALQVVRAQAAQAAQAHAAALQEAQAQAAQAAQLQAQLQVQLQRTGAQASQQQQQFLAQLVQQADEAKRQAEKLRQHVLEQDAKLVQLQAAEAARLKQVRLDFNSLQSKRQYEEEQNHQRIIAEYSKRLAQSINGQTKKQLENALKKELEALELEQKKKELLGYMQQIPIQIQKLLTQGISEGDNEYIRLQRLLSEKSYEYRQIEQYQQRNVGASVIRQHIPINLQSSPHLLSQVPNNTSSHLESFSLSNILQKHNRAFLEIFNDFVDKFNYISAPNKNKSNVTNKQPVELFQTYMKEFFYDRTNLQTTKFIKRTEEGTGTNTIFKNSIMIFDIFTNEYYIFIFIIDQKTNRLSCYCNTYQRLFPIQVTEKNTFYIDFELYKIKILKASNNKVHILINIPQTIESIKFTVPLLVMHNPEYKYFYLESYDIPQNLDRLQLKKDNRKNLLACIKSYPNNYTMGFTLGNIGDNKLFAFYDKKKGPNLVFIVRDNDLFFLDKEMNEQQMVLQTSELVYRNLKIKSDGIFLNEKKMKWTEERFFHFEEKRPNLSRRILNSTILGAQSIASTGKISIPEVNNNNTQQPQARLRLGTIEEPNLTETNNSIITAALEKRQIIEASFPGVFAQNSLVYKFTISSEKYEVNLQRNRITFNLVAENSSPVSKKIQENDTKDIFYADFETFYILFIKKVNIIAKQVIFNGCIMELNIEHLENKSSIWDSNFTKQFEQVVQGKEYETVMNRSFPYKNYTSGFNLYDRKELRKEHNFYLLIIKGGNIQKSEDIFSIIFTNKSIYFGLPENAKEFEKGEQNNLLFAVLDMDIYVIDINKPFIFKHDNNKLYMLIWFKEGFYNWNEITINSNNRINKLKTFIQSLRTSKVPEEGVAESAPVAAIPGTRASNVNNSVVKEAPLASLSNALSAAIIPPKNLAQNSALINASTREATGQAQHPIKQNASKKLIQSNQNQVDFPVHSVKGTGNK